MTELQVKTKKGSLKKFFAMFLAVCVPSSDPLQGFVWYRRDRWWLCRMLGQCWPISARRLSI